MIDVQIVAGGRPDVLRESLRGLQEQDAPIEHVWIANNQGVALGIEDERDVTVVEVADPLTFEQNHNRLASMGSSPFVLFLDDDAFLFDGALATLFAHLREQRDVAVVGGVNNQTFPITDIPSVGSLADFAGCRAACEGVASSLAGAQRDVWAPRIFMPGNCLLVRRKIWQKEYGGWDEGYRNWNEEVDFTSWCFERGYRSLCTPSVWFFHCQGQSREIERMHADILVSARHFAEKWPLERAERFMTSMQRQGLHRLAVEFQMLMEASVRDSDPDRLRASPYFLSMQAALSDS